MLRRAWCCWAVWLCTSASAAACASSPAQRLFGTQGPLDAQAREWSRRGATVATPAAPAPPPWHTSAPLPELRPFTPAELDRIHPVQRTVRDAARAYRLPPDLVNAIIWVESRFKVRARSPRGPLGLMQLMPRTGREVAQALGTTYRPYDPTFNIHAGSYYFAQLLERFGGNLRLSLAAYNIGPQMVQDWVRHQQPLSERSERYIENVFIASRSFRAHGF